VNPAHPSYSGRLAQARELFGRASDSAAALAYALGGDVTHGQSLADDLAKQFPEDTLAKFDYLPEIRAEIALDQRDPAKAIEALQPASSYELGSPSPVIITALYPSYVRGEAYLAAHNGSAATAEFQKILDHPGVVLNEPIGALAHLQIARAFALEAQSAHGADAATALANARRAYQDFLALWQHADPSIPILIQTKSEYAKLGQ